MRRVILSILFSLHSTAAFAEGELVIFNFFDYTSPELISKFENDFDVKVTIDTYETNEEMVEKVKSNPGKYDVSIPSDYT